ncbi:hypothetical protein AC4HA13_0033 [Escherichia phage vB_EcoM_4HA13]|uniref:Uncharacterized protein n=1 Tax=Escherichia phage vB_EcoM_4HA13 TaxID=2601675 RepID=A0A7D0J655_9CAUD|nr:hypothetical protein HYP96_gp33 [Escherichia phage vB_EcoM_4HA13]QEM43003.1 hypothetical protein AC4HA13_0033 [Escherichia phage vB_EcoM_4HA13]
MKVVDDNKVDKVDVLSIALGDCFEANDMVFLRIVEVEMMHLTDGVTLRNVVGTRVEDGTYFCIPDYTPESVNSRMVKPVCANVVITGNPKLVDLTKVE